MKESIKLQGKNLLNMKIVANYLNFVFRIEVKKQYKIFNLSKTQNDPLATRISLIRVPIGF